MVVSLPNTQTQNRKNTITMEYTNPMMPMPVTPGSCDNNNMWNNPFMYLIWLAIFRQNGLFGTGNGNNTDPSVTGQTLNSA